MTPKRWVNTSKGISQAERFFASLDPAFVALEDRSTDELLQFLLNFSRRINYFRHDNKPDGDWEDFFLSDIHVVVRIINSHDINQYIRAYDQLKGHVLRAGQIQHLSYAKAIFQFLYDFILFQAKLHYRFAQVPGEQTGVNEFRRIIAGYNSLTEEFLSIKSLAGQFNRYFPDEKWQLEIDIKEKTLFQESDAQLNAEAAEPDWWESGLKQLDHLFAQLRAKYFRLQEAAGVFWHLRQTSGISYLPHTAMLVTFLDLYQALRKELNTLPKKHLDFYYHDILNLPLADAAADRVYLQVALSPSIQKLVVQKGEVLQLDRPDMQENNRFTVDNDMVITQATIRDLRSLFVSESVKLPSKKDDVGDIYELQVFSSVNKVYQPGDFIQADPTLKTWPLLGEDQEDISRDLMSMQPADLGFVMASPVLYAQDGKRNFHVRIYLSQNSYRQLRRYAMDYRDVSGMHERIIMHNMLKEAFYLDITGPENWISIRKFNISCDIDDPDSKDNCLDIHFELLASDPPTALYHKEIHGENYDAVLPVLRFRVNNSSFYNPYTFFRGLRLERITIRLSVSESRQLKLRNNIGELSMLNPFQLFGPQPAVGSYLDVKNTNIFNKYTKDFSIQLHWFDLPRLNGGFQGYYEAYPNKVTNDSFQVSLSGLNDGKYYPEIGNQQAFRLFSSGSRYLGDKSGLAHITVINGVDFMKVRFENYPQLDEESIVSETGFTNGTIRLELISPTDAFGAKTFNSLFPEIVMHNARRFVKKKSLPNPPYIPVLKSISVDYVLEHTESFSDIATDSIEDNGVFVWHVYPFGYKKVYPGKDMDSFTLIPSFSHQSNCYIGLEQVIPGELLSLLFQFEENNFDHFDYIPEDIIWSVLIDNVWMPLPKGDILVDETENLIRSGMVVLRMPGQDATGNTILPGTYTWVRASCNNRGNIRTKTRAVFAQLISASRQLTQTGSLKPEDLILSPGSFTQFRRKIPQVLNLFQPFVSFNGRLREQEKQFYTRISELLRHKNRAVTSNDIAQLVLNAFPDILKVKCFDTESGGRNLLPGYDLAVVVIRSPQKREGQLEEFPKADLSQLVAIREYLKGLLSPFIRVEVINPVYERIKIACSVVFQTTPNGPGFTQNSIQESNGVLLQKLNREIKEWIAPWLYQSGTKINTEVKLYLSEILNFIKKRPYISYVTGFSVLHFYQIYDTADGNFYDRVTDSAVERVEYLMPSHPLAILVSSSEHSISLLDKPRYVEPIPTGIGGMVIGSELLVADHNTHVVLKDENTGEDDENQLFHFQFQIS